MNTSVLPQRHRSIRPTNYAAAFEKMKREDQLNDKEQHLYESLKSLNSNTFWGDCIKDVFKDYSVLKFRELYQELLSQNDDNPEMMERILGNAYPLLINLKP